MPNSFAEYVHDHMVVLEGELPGLIPFDQKEIDDAIASGVVNMTPVSVHSQIGVMYWSSDVLVQAGMNLAAGRVASYVGGDGIIGTARTVEANDGVFDRRTAQIVLSYGRHAGFFDEHEISGIGVYTKRTNTDSIKI